MQQIINNGSFDNDPSADKIRINFDDANSNFTELYAGLALGGSILSIDQPISMAGATQGEPETKQVADAINARTNDFTIPLGSIPLVSSYLPHVSGDNLTAYVRKNTYLLNTGDGSYGTTGSITLDASNIIKIGEEIVKPSTVIDMADIGATALSTAVNNATPSNTKLGLTLVTALQSGVQQNYIFDAADGDYGSGDLQTSSDNFIDLNTEPDLSRNITDDAVEPFTRAIDVTIAVEDLGRTDVFTQSNSTIEVDTDANLFIESGSSFLIQFTGTGTHTVNIPSLTASSTTYSQYDIVLVQKIGASNWFATKLGEVSTAQPDLTNVVHINSLADFATPVSSVIELAPNPGDEITYILAVDDIDIGSNRFKNTGGDIVIIGSHRTASGITSSTSGTLFTSVDGFLSLEFIGATAPNAKIIEFSTPVATFKSFVANNFIIRDCDTIGTISGAFTTSLRTMTVIEAQTGGLLWTGTDNSQINISNMLGLSWAGTLLDLGTATFDIIDFSAGNRFISPAGTTILSGASGSANLKVGGRALVDNTLFNGLGTALSGIGTEDLQWDFKNNIFVDNSTKNTEVVTDAFLTGSETVTIGSIGVFIAVGGTNWTTDINKRFTVGTDGLVTYVGLETIDIIVSNISTVEKVGGGSDTICSKIAINGTVSDKTMGCTENTTPTGITSSGLFEVETGDTIQQFVSNEDSTSNVIVSNSNMIISKR